MQHQQHCVALVRHTDIGTSQPHTVAQDWLQRPAPLHCRRPDKAQHASHNMQQMKTMQQCSIINELNNRPNSVFIYKTARTTKRIPSLICTCRADPNLTKHKSRMPFRNHRAPAAHPPRKATRSIRIQFASLQSISADNATVVYSPLEMNCSVISHSMENTLHSYANATKHCPQLYVENAHLCKTLHSCEWQVVYQSALLHSMFHNFGCHMLNMTVSTDMTIHVLCSRAGPSDVMWEACNTRDKSKGHIMSSLRHVVSDVLLTCTQMIATACLQSKNALTMLLALTWMMFNMSAAALYMHTPHFWLPPPPACRCFTIQSIYIGAIMVYMMLHPPMQVPTSLHCVATLAVGCGFVLNMH